MELATSATPVEVRTFKGGKELGPAKLALALGTPGDEDSGTLLASPGTYAENLAFVLRAADDTPAWRVRPTEIGHMTPACERFRYRSLGLFVEADRSEDHATETA